MLSGTNQLVVRKMYWYSTSTTWYHEISKFHVYIYIYIYICIYIYIYKSREHIIYICCLFPRFLLFWYTWKPHWCPCRLAPPWRGRGVLGRIRAAPGLILAGNSWIWPWNSAGKHGFSIFHMGGLPVNFPSNPVILGKIEVSRESWRSDYKQWLVIWRKHVLNIVTKRRSIIL